MAGKGQEAGQGGSVQSRSTPPGSFQEERVAEGTLPIAPKLGAEGGAPGSPASPGSSNSRSGLRDVQFNFDHYSLRPDGRDAVEDNAASLTATRDWTHLSLEGRCDEIGSSAYNLVLGERRAKAVKQYLGALGIPASSIEVISYGKERPLCTEHNAECWQKNRTVHFSVK
jgi:peptidoglycan-associated lipoprotein